MKPKKRQPPGGTPNGGAKPAELYTAGQRYAGRVAALRATRSAHRTAVAAAASAAGATPAAVRRAIAFAAAVDAIAVNAPAAKALILNGHPRLSVPVVMKVSHTHPERQRFAVARAAAGLDPFGKPPPGTDPPFDTLNPAEILNRLARNAGALAAVARGFLSAPVEQWPAEQKIAAIRDHAAAIRSACRRMGELLSIDAGTVLRVGRQARSAGGSSVPGRTTPVRDALGAVARAAGVTAKNLRDLPRVLVDTPPTPTERVTLLERVRNLGAAAARLVAVLDARGPHGGTSPDAVLEAANEGE